MVLFIAPLAAIPAMFATALTGDLGMVIARLQDTTLLPMILANSLLAFTVNAVVACTIWMFNPTGFLVAGISKDLGIIAAASHWFGASEHLTKLQCIGFSIAMAGITLYGTYKIQKGNLPCIPRRLCGGRGGS